MLAGGALATAHVSFLVILSLFIFLSQLWRAPRLCATCGALLSEHPALLHAAGTFPGPCCALPAGPALPGVVWGKPPGLIPNSRLAPSAGAHQLEQGET